jgi:hypothetical protein
MSKELHDVPGPVAELGVFEGDFTCVLNACFPDRRCFLYDTFTVFNTGEYWSCDEDRDKKTYAELYGKCADSSAKDIQEEIRQKCPYPEKLIFCKGLFPGTAVKDQEERFAFVAIDVDQYDSIFSGLEFFYPRVQEGGAIFLRPYRGRSVGGAEIITVQRAVQDIEKKFGRLKKVPLPDFLGTLVIVK